MPRAALQLTQTTTFGGLNPLATTTMRVLTG